MPKKVRALPSNLGERLLDDLTARARRLPPDWKAKLTRTFPRKRRLAAENMDVDTLRLADRTSLEPQLVA